MWYWIIPAWVASLVAVYLLGYCMRGLVKRVVELEQVLQSKLDKPPLPEEPSSIIIDELDPVQVAIRERDELMRKLNNG